MTSPLVRGVGLIALIVAGAGAALATGAGAVLMGEALANSAADDCDSPPKYHDRH